MKAIVFLLFAALLVVSGHAKVFTKCGLAKELTRLGVSRQSLPHWVCLVRAESNYNTAAVGGPNSNGSKDWGLFQINDRYWCKQGGPGKDCNINCQSLINNNIDDDFRCAQKIYKRHGFNAWYGYLNKCKGNLPSVNECF